MNYICIFVQQCLLLCLLIIHKQSLSYDESVICNVLQMAKLNSDN